MNKSIIIGIIAVVFVVGGFFVFSNQNGEDVTMQKEKVMEKGDIAMEKKGDAVMEKKNDSMVEKEVMMEAGSYETYSAEKISKTTTNKVILFFRAGWCPTCRAVDGDIKANLKNIPAGVTILDVNYDDSSALKQKYDVTYQHTFVQVDAQGNKIKKWQSSPTLAALVAELK